MRLVLRTPTKRRANRYAAAFGTIGTLIGSLPVGVRQKRRRPSLAKLMVPITGGAALLAFAARKRRRSDLPDTWNAPVSSVHDHGAASPVPPASPAPMPVAPPTTPPVTETAREKADATGGGNGTSGSPGTARAAASETPAAGDDAGLAVPTESEDK